MQRIADHIGIDLQELLFGNPEGAPLRELAQGMEQAVAAPQPAPIWHPYPAERPTEGQTVLVCKEHSEYGRSYSALLYRDACWYLPELPDCQMSVDVCWWSAELAPEESEALKDGKND